MPFTFNVEKPRDVKNALEKLKKMIEDGGGSLIGDEARGTISYNAVQGRYIVGADAIEVTILKKPAFLPEPVIRKYISGGLRRLD